jgi:cell division protein FtsZ
MNEISSKIKVVGVGGAGSNAVSRIKKSNIKGVELIVINTDAQDLNSAKADIKIRIGRELTKGLGTGMNPEIGRLSAEENIEEIKNAIKGTELIFIAYGSGGGTGTGAGPVIAKIAREMGILVIGVVTKPFTFEGITRKEISKEGIKEFKKNVDSMLLIENDNLLTASESKISLAKAFEMCDDVLKQAVQGIIDLILMPGIVNADFADVKKIIRKSGTALFGVGIAKGEERAEKAAKAAMNSNLLNISPKGAKGILFNVSGGDDISIMEIEEISKIFGDKINPNADIIFGAVKDNSLAKGEIKVTLIATGF